MRRFIAISLVSLVFAFGIVFVIDLLMGTVMGGLGTYVGFPIPYFIDRWSSPGIELDRPELKFANVLIFDTLITLIIWLIFKPRKK